MPQNSQSKMIIILITIILVLTSILLSAIAGLVIIPGLSRRYLVSDIEGVTVSLVYNSAFSTVFGESFIVSITNTGEKPVTVEQLENCTIYANNKTYKGEIYPTIELPVTIKPNTSYSFTVILKAPILKTIVEKYGDALISIDIVIDGVRKRVYEKLGLPSTFCGDIVPSLIIVNATLHRLEDHKNNLATIILEAWVKSNSFTPVNITSIVVDAIEIKFNRPITVKYIRSIVVNVTQTSINDSEWGLYSSHVVRIYYVDTYGNKHYVQYIHAYVIGR